MNKVLGQFMIEPMKAQQCSFDEGIYCSSGGKLVYTTMNSRSCSVRDISLDDFENTKDPKTNDTSTTSWTFHKLVQRYKKYANPSNKKVNAVKNFYTWASENSVRGTEVISSFYGYKARPRWSLSEELCKITPTLYKPMTLLL